MNAFLSFPTRLLCCLLLATGFALSIQAQTIQGGGQSYLTISDTALLVRGISFANNMRVQFNGGNAVTPNWKLTVQPLTAYFAAQQTSAGDVAQFGPGPNWPIQYFSIKLNPGASQNSWSNANSINEIGAVSSTIPLSASEITLVEKSNYKMVASDYFALSYDLILNGSRQLLTLHRDDYIVVMRFRLYNASGNLVSQMDYNHQIGLWPGWMHLPQSGMPQITNGILLQNGGSNVTLSFGQDAQSYAAGVESNLNNSLQVSSSDGKYQVTVQTLSNYFTRSGTASGIPVSKIRLTASPYSSAVVSSYTPVSLSTTARTLILNNGSGSAGVVNNYNLNYSTKANANQDAFLNVEAGSYETQITFIMNPL
ncbi:hypothetical protein [Taibaiella koreensis]|uniref:hypothetical protein n=1 Tax=Taibaiella koreensis TaxID=1268548 RepID=UPI000E59E42D|nr:hypothetical protein [Taibaiella koreensis]